MIKAIIFDCFGVIRIDATLAAYKNLGGDPEADVDFIKEAVGKVNRGESPSLTPLIAERLKVTAEQWRHAVQSGSAIDYEVLDYVKDLRSKYKTAMLSNMAPGGLKIWFSPGQLDEYFDVCVASGDIGFAKPQAQAYQIAADKLGVRFDECVMIDDREELYKGALDVGMKAILYTGFNQMKQELEKILAAGPDN